MDTATRAAHKCVNRLKPISNLSNKAFMVVACTYAVNRVTEKRGEMAIVPFHPISLKHAFLNLLLCKKLFQGGPMLRAPLNNLFPSSTFCGVKPFCFVSPT